MIRVPDADEVRPADNGLSEIEKRNDSPYEGRITSWVDWLKKNGEKEKEEIFRYIYIIIGK